MPHMTQKKRDKINKKLFNSTFNNMKIGQNVGLLGYQCKFKAGTERVNNQMASFVYFLQKLLILWSWKESLDRF